MYRQVKEDCQVFKGYVEIYFRGIIKEVLVKVQDKSFQHKHYYLLMAKLRHNVGFRIKRVGVSKLMLNGH